MKKIIILLALFLISACVRSPQPISLFETEEKALKDISNIEEIKKDNKAWEENLEIDLYTAIALAIKNNKELKVKLLENALANRQIDKIKFEMLPSLAANAGYSGSKYYKTTTSANVSTKDRAGAMGEDYSTSTERSIANQDIGFTWNALDFGLSYIKAGQSNNRYLISDEAEKKASHNIVREVIRTYWNSLSAEKLIKQYHTKAPFVKKLMDNVTRKAEDRGKIRTLGGRACHFDLWQPTQFGIFKPLPLEQARKEYDEPLKRAFTYKALNKLIQGSAADMTKKSMVALYENGIIPHIQIHDEVDISVESDKKTEEIINIMESAV